VTRPRTSDQLVVDASVAVKWYLTDEPDTAPAFALLQAFEAVAVLLAAPTQILYEVPSAIALATRRAQPRLSEADAQRAITAFTDLGIQTFTDAALLRATYPLCQQLAIAFYDAAYLALAQRLGIPFITADDKLYRRTRQLPGVLWIGDYAV